MKDYVIILRNGYEVHIRGIDGEKITMETVCQKTGKRTDYRTFTHKNLTGEKNDQRGKKK